MLPLFWYATELSAACSTTNEQVLDFGLFSVPKNLNTGDVIATRSVNVHIHCDANSLRKDLGTWDNSNYNGYILFRAYRRYSGQVTKGVDIRLTVIDPSGKKNPIKFDADNPIYYITDADLKVGFDKTYQIQLDLTRRNESLPTGTTMFKGPGGALISLGLAISVSMILLLIVVTFILKVSLTLEVPVVLWRYLILSPYQESAPLI